jgi:hypothetical protein
VESLGKVDHLVELFVLHPILKFTRIVSAIGATLEHGDHDNLDGNRCAFGAAAGRAKKREDEREGGTHS